MRSTGPVDFTPRRTRLHDVFAVARRSRCPRLEGRVQRTSGSVRELSLGPAQRSARVSRRSSRRCLEPLEDPRRYVSGLCVELVIEAPRQRSLPGRRRRTETRGPASREHEREVAALRGAQVRARRRRALRVQLRISPPTITRVRRGGTGIDGETWLVTAESSFRTRRARSLRSWCGPSR